MACQSCLEELCCGCDLEHSSPSDDTSSMKHKYRSSLMLRPVTSRDRHHGAVQIRLWQDASRGAAVAVLAGISILMQGCEVPRTTGFVDISNGVSTHKVAFWRQKPEYYARFSYVEKSTNETAFNSCMDMTVSNLEVCSGRGHCELFNRKDITNPVFYCHCNTGWIDPECKTKQKSQAVAWLVSLSLGPLGLDEFYLGHSSWGALKLMLTIIAFFVHYLGSSRPACAAVIFAWFNDVVRIGSAPVRASDFKVAADLPRWAFSVFTMLFFAFVGFALGVTTLFYQVRQRRSLADKWHTMYGTNYTRDLSLDDIKTQMV
mmetsp:Transcript_48415/g.85290  ORF Transcript_48415/g.85290 Transcript_48415/m.85290 type:complete len:317 (+) Transcript_48415:6-956(+)